METNYPTLERPKTKRKLSYFTKNDVPSKQWAGKLSLKDVSRMFDDLDSASHDDCEELSSLLPDTENKQGEKEASVVPQEGHLTEKPPRCKMVPKEVLHPATRSDSSKLNIDLDIPIKGHGPVKTSSPIQADVGAEEQDNEKDQAMSPILFLCEDQEQEEAEKEPLPIQKPQCNGNITEESDDFSLESPPRKVVLIKPKLSHKNKVEATCKESHQGSKKITKKPQIPILEGKRETQSQENTDLPVSAMRQEPKHPAPEKNSGVHRDVNPRVGKEMTAFLQKLRDAGQPKPARSSRKSLLPVKVPTCPPEPEDDFMILEDDAPIRFSILSKNTIKKRQKQSKTSSTDKDSSADMGMKDVCVSPEATQKQQESDQADRKLQSQTVNQKMKKKGKQRVNEVTETEHEMDKYILSSLEDLPAVDKIVEQDKPNQKTQQRLKKVRSKESDKVEDKPKDTDIGETHEANSPKPQKSSEVKRSKSSKYEKENAGTSKAKKWTRKEIQGSDRVKETVKEQRSSEEHADVEDLGSLSDKELRKSEAQTPNGKTRQKKQSVVSGGNSSDDGQVLGKRKRNPPGQWWLNCPESTEETNVTDNQPILKSSKQNHKELGAEVSPPVNAKNNRLLKQRKHSTNKKKIKRNKRSATIGDNPEKTKARVEELHMIDSEQIEDQEQQDVSDQDLDPAQSSPLAFLHRDHSFSSGDQIFQRAYHHSDSEKIPKTLAAPASPRIPSEQLGTPKREKRSRKPPGTWWKVDNMTEDMESISSEPQQLNPKEPKPRKERNPRTKQSRSPELWTSKKGNAAVSSKPPGGAPVTSLKPRQLLAPKTVKHSLATFKEIFTSATESPVDKSDAGQKNIREVTVCPAEDCRTLSKTNKEIPRMDAGEFNHESPSARSCSSTSTVLRSGPSSMIELERYEEDDDMVLPSSKVIHSALCASDLCGPPLKPLILQVQDKVNLAEWLKSLWPATGNNGSEITPDQFDWYFYRGRAIGFLQDLQSGSILSGKILLGSFMKKPLWVDHSATTVFNLLSSSVRVTIDCSETCFNPGQSFMVQCGHAYSIQNLAAQPAVLYFTRILAESPD